MLPNLLNFSSADTELLVTGGYFIKVISDISGGLSETGKVQNLQHNLLSHCENSAKIWNQAKIWFL